MSDVARENKRGGRVQSSWYQKKTGSLKAGAIEVEANNMLWSAGAISDPQSGCTGLDAEDRVHGERRVNTFAPHEDMSWNYA